MKSAEISHKIQELLIQRLKAVPHVHHLDYWFGRDDSLSDLTIEVTADQDVYRLLVVIKVSGQPRYAREAVALLAMELSKSSKSGYPVFAAPFVSKAAAQICMETGTGYIDLAGNCRLAFDGIYLERQGHPNRFMSRRSLHSLYQARSSRVLRALLFNPNLTWKLSDLSQAAGVSIGQVFNVKKVLIDREWAKFDKEGLRLVQPEQVLRDWGEHYSFRKNTFSPFHSTETISEMEHKVAERLSAEGLRFALTSFSACARMVPAVSYTHVFAYVDGDINHIAALLDLKPADSEPNLTLMLPYDEGVFYGMKQIEGIHTVSKIQAYLDLIGLKKTGEEAAEILFGQVIQKEWQPGPIAAEI
jgi:hypothetical protein